MDKLNTLYWILGTMMVVFTLYYYMIIKYQISIIPKILGTYMKHISRDIGTLEFAIIPDMIIFRVLWIPTGIWLFLATTILLTVDFDAETIYQWLIVFSGFIFIYTWTINLSGTLLYRLERDYLTYVDLMDLNQINQSFLKVYYVHLIAKLVFSIMISCLVVDSNVLGRVILAGLIYLILTALWYTYRKVYWDKKVEDILHTATKLSKENTPW